MVLKLFEIFISRLSLLSHKSLLFKSFEFSHREKFSIVFKLDNECKRCKSTCLKYELDKTNPRSYLIWAETNAD